MYALFLYAVGGKHESDKHDVIPVLSGKLSCS